MSENWSDMEEPVREVEPPPAPEQVGKRPPRYQQSVMFEEEAAAAPVAAPTAAVASPPSGSNAETQRGTGGSTRRSSGGRDRKRGADDSGTAVVVGGDVNAEAQRASGAARTADEGFAYYKPLVDRSGELIERRAQEGAGGAYLAPSVLDDEIISDDMGRAAADAEAVIPPVEDAPARVVEEEVDSIRGAVDVEPSAVAIDDMRLEGEEGLPEAPTSVVEAASPSWEGTRRVRRATPGTRQQRQAEQRRETKTMRTYSDGLPPIKVVGVGGGGCNAVSRMIAEHIAGVQFVAVNTDGQALQQSPADVKIRIGDKLTKGLGVGGDPGRGLRAAEESEDDLLEAVRGAEMVFVTAGMGGGTGTGASPIVARVAKDAGALTIGVVTKPFSFEGTKRWQKAEEGIQRLQDEVDTLIVIPNDRLLSVCDEKVTYEEAFRTADDVLLQGIRGISEIITLPGEINLDFADVRNVMSEAGQALMSIGTGAGPTRAEDAARMAIESPMLEVSIHGARAVLYNIVGGKNLGLHEINAAAEVIQSVVDPDAEIFFGTAIDPEMGDEVRITLIATGFSTLRSVDRIPDEFRKAVPDDVVTIQTPEAMERMEAEAEAQPNNRELPAFLRRRITAR